MSESLAADNNSANKRANPLLYIVVGVVIILLCCCSVIFIVSRLIPTFTNSATGQSDNNLQSEKQGLLEQLAETSGTSQPIAASDNEETKIVGDLEVTLNTVEKDSLNYIFDLTIRNNNSSPVFFSSLSQTYLVNQDGETYNKNIFYVQDTAESLDREIPSKGSIRGLVVFTVDDSPSELDLNISESFIGEELASFKIF